MGIDSSNLESVLSVDLKNEREALVEQNNPKNTNKNNAAAAAYEDHTQHL